MPIGAILAGLSALKTVTGAVGGAKKAAGLASHVAGGGLSDGNSGQGGKGGGLLGKMNLAPENLLMGGIGAVKNIAGLAKQKQADSMLPQAEDPEQRALASYAARRKRAFQTGTALSSQRNASLQAMKTGVNASFKVGGGAKGLNMMTQLFNQSQLGLQDKALAGESQFAKMESEQKNTIAQRKLELGLLKYNTEQARAAQLRKEGKSTSNLALARATGIEEINPYGTGGVQNTTTGSSSGTNTVATVDSE